MISSQLEYYNIVQCGIVLEITNNKITITKIIKRLHILLCPFLTWISYKYCKQGLKSGTPYIDIVLLFSGGKY